MEAADVTAIGTSISGLSSTIVGPLGIAVIGVVVAIVSVKLAVRMARGV